MRPLLVFALAAAIPLAACGSPQSAPETASEESGDTRRGGTGDTRESAGDTRRGGTGDTRTGTEDNR
ncbi:MAG: hypothetical protein ACMVO5_07655 [Polymorphobacter sp.]|uniref:hypothetical protein n=1 Tax=Polymorphobacter sp. TaxID=1909290 RepID=UPI003A8A0C80